MPEETPKKKKNINLKIAWPHFAFGRDADNDWGLMCKAFLFLFVISIGFNAFLFIKFVLFNSQALKTDVQFELINKQKIADIIGDLEKKAVEFEKIRAEYKK